MAPKQPTVMNAEGELVMDERSPREKRYEQWTTLPLIFASFLFLLAYSVLILDDLAFRSPLDQFLLGLLIVVWVMFIVDYFVRLLLATNKRAFVRRNILDMMSMAIPFLRPFLLLLYLSRLRFFKKRTGSSLRARVIVYAASFAIMFVYVISLAEFAAERHLPNASIKNYGDSLWWAMETISTVGYGDMIPISAMGRFYAVLLMLGGMIIVGATTATVLSYLTERLQVAHKKNQEQLARQAAKAAGDQAAEKASSKK